MSDIKPTEYCISLLKQIINHVRAEDTEKELDIKAVLPDLIQLQSLIEKEICKNSNIIDIENRNQILQKYLSDAENEVCRLFTELSHKNTNVDILSKKIKQVENKYEYLLTHTKELEDMLNTKEEELRILMVEKNQTYFGRNQSKKSADDKTIDYLSNMNNSNAELLKDKTYKIKTLEEENKLLRISLRDLNKNNRVMLEGSKSQPEIPLAYELLLTEQKDEIGILKDQIELLKPLLKQTNTDTDLEAAPCCCSVQ